MPLGLPEPSILAAKCATHIGAWAVGLTGLAAKQPMWHACDPTVLASPEAVAAGGSEEELRMGESRRRVDSKTSSARRVGPSPGPRRGAA